MRSGLARRLDRFGLLALTAVAALLRLPGTDARGTFDADQGHDMLVLAAFTRDGVVPLLGPRTSVGEFHHGAFYYFLLAPAAAISNGDPVAVTVFIALLGIGAVALTWWLARAIGGPVAGALAGLLMAVSPAAIEQSTFIWNPNPIAFFAVLSLAAAFHARTGARSGARPKSAWWAIAIGAAGAVTQLHVLGVVFLLAMLVIAVTELRRERRLALGIAGGLGLIVVLFLPLIAHELQTGLLETRRILDYLAAGDEPLGGGPVFALAFTLLRVVGWPFVGVVTDVPAVAAVLLAVVVGLAAIGLLRARANGRRAPAERANEAVGLRWLVAILAWSTVALAFAAPSLQRVVAGLPNDHYHAFLDPIVIILVAVPAAGVLEAAVAAWRTTRRPVGALVGIAIGVGLAVVVVVALARKPPDVDPNGGWPAMRDAGQRIVDDAGGAAIEVVGLPGFKSPEAISYPIELAGGRLTNDAIRPVNIVVACDRLFEAAGGYICGGPAEDAFIGTLAGPDDPSFATLVDRFDASARTAISVYAP